ncbi:hypothetical protein DL240_16045 [Lujinxingia litoralis]|uniref:Methyltransferase type 11 domain-containing protein n=1 Tax=Lujinxingia litoralis TaxID=2211119 RepID=A0A328C2Q0_9DELT|nr:hypothetical protein DL240_16045 [Lujinxingia litoralis]
MALVGSAALTLWVALGEEPPREAVASFLGVVVLSTLMLGWGLWSGWGWLGSGPRWLGSGPRWRGVAVVLAGAVLLRCAALVAPVSLSDDVWRYTWDGALVAAGENPYAETPRERVARLGGQNALADEVRAELGRMNSPDYHTLYPPLAMLAFAAGDVLAEVVGGSAERWLRGLFVLADLLAVLLIARALLTMRRAVGWAALYAWHPLVYWEVAGGGHTEALAVGWMVLLVVMLGRRPAWQLGAAIGAMALAKLTFLVVSPVVGMALWRRGRFAHACVAALVAIGVVAVGYVPFWFEDLVANQRASAELYAEVFSFDAPIFYAARALLGYREGITPPVTPVLGPILQAATLAGITLASAWQDGSRRRVAAGMCGAWAAYLLFTAVLHPWYALGLLAAAALAGWWSVSLAASVLLLSYLFYDPAFVREKEVMVMIFQTFWVGASVMMQAGPRGIQWMLRRRARAKVEVLSPYLRAGDRVLDLGAGEGFVGQLIAEAGHEVVLADVDNRNRTELPFEVYDGEHLPFEDDAFDAVVIVYTLHHARRPDRVLAEARRVARRVILLETVYERSWDRRLTTFLDHSANRLRGMAPEPLHFDRVEGWLARLRAQSLEVLTWRWLGRGVHRHVVIVADRAERSRDV